MRFRVAVSCLAPWLFAVLPVSSRGAEPADSIQLKDLKAHVEVLASDAYEGRRGEGALKARDYVAAAFEKAGLIPAGENGFLQEIPKERGKGEGALGFNVLGLLPGADPRLKKEYVIFSAHHDHLGKGKDGIFHGADDDATGVAVLLEAARVLKKDRAPLKRSVLFISFDLEERGLQGAVHFIRHPTIPIEDVALFINMDMLGRDMGGFIEGYVFALGTEFAPRLKKIVQDAGNGSGLKIGFVGTDVIGIRGDYGPFLERKIPYLFFSTGEHPDYHKTTDTADRILYEKLNRNAGILLRTLLAAADMAERPAFSEPAPDLDEVKVVADVVDQVLRKSKELNLKKEELAAVSLMRFSIKEILDRGKITPEEREQLKGLSQQIMGALRR